MWARVHVCVCDSRWWFFCRWFFCSNKIFNFHPNRKVNRRKKPAQENRHGLLWIAVVPITLCINVCVCVCACVTVTLLFVMACKSTIISDNFQCNGRRSKCDFSFSLLTVREMRIRLWCASTIETQLKTHATRQNEFKQCYSIGK